MKQIIIGILLSRNYWHRSYLINLFDIVLFWLIQ